MKKFIFCSLVLILIGCDREFVPPKGSSLSTMEEKLARVWVYQSIQIMDTVLIDADRVFDPLKEKFCNQNNVDCRTYEVSRRHIRYESDHSYELQWDIYGQYELGSGLNWQPSFGSWNIDESGTKLIHNNSQLYETTYEIIELSDDLFVRSSQRVMQETIDPSKWLPGDIVAFKEVFRPKGN